MVRAGSPLLHVEEWDVAVRADPMVVKAHGLWAESICDQPFAQWTLGVETYAAALDDPAAALGRAYGERVAIAWDLEWYATEPAEVMDAGYHQRGVVHGAIDLASGGPGAAVARIEVAEVRARRWHRWGGALGPLVLDPVLAHTGLRAPFAFPDGTVADWVLLPDGWRARPLT